LTLACGKDKDDVAELNFLMALQGVITGTVVDEDNEAVANATVEAFSYRAVSQRGYGGASGVARTDDLGKYRIYGISPGRYYVSARVRDFSGITAVTTQQKQQVSYVPAYYPGTNRASAATPIQVVGGQESAADLTLSKAPTMRVGGKLFSDVRVGRAAIVAYPEDQPSWDPGERHVTEVDDSTGKFVFQGLQPGPYTFVCDRLDGGVRHGARLAVNVGTKNIDNIEMTMSRYPDLAGRVTVEGGGQVPAGIKVSLEPRQALASMAYGWARPDNEGKFKLEAISPDLSDVTVSNLPVGYFVKSVTFAGREVSDTGIELGLGGLRTADIVISPNGATLEGSVSDAQDNPSAGATVVLIPGSGRRHLKSSYYTTTADQNGGFKVSGIGPGEFTLVAWESLATIDYTDPEALDTSDKRGQILKLEEGGRKTVQLKVLLSTSLVP
jgi:hypothetical protein